MGAINATHLLKFISFIPIPEIVKETLIVGCP